MENFKDCENFVIPSDLFEIKKLSYQLISISMNLTNLNQNISEELLVSLMMVPDLQ